MGIDVVDLARIDAGVFEGHLHRACRVTARWIRLGHVLRVGRKPVAGDLGVDLGATGARAFELLEHEHRARLAHHEAVALRVERPAGTLRIFVATRERAHRTEAGDPDLVDRRLGPAAEHHVGATKPDVVEPLADRHVRRRARGALGRERPACAELHRYPARAHVGDDARDRKRVDPVRAALDQRVVAVLEGLDPADPGRDRRADAVSVGADLEARVGLGLPCGREDQLREAVHAPRLLAIDPVGRIEVLHLAREVHEVVARVELRDLRRTRFAREQVPP